MTFAVRNLVGCQAIATTSATAQHPLGTIVEGWDPTYGYGEFIYLLGVGSTLLGSWVTYDATTWQTALGTQVAGQARPVAFAMSANVATQYGWYQIEGLAVAKKTNVATLPQVNIFQSATAGRIKTLLSLGIQILGARTANLTTIVNTTSNVTILINRPHCQGQII